MPGIIDRHVARLSEATIINTPTSDKATGVSYAFILTEEENSLDGFLADARGMPLGLVLTRVEQDSGQYEYIWLTFAQFKGYADAISVSKAQAAAFIRDIEEHELEDGADRGLHRKYEQEFKDLSVADVKQKLLNHFPSHTANKTGVLETPIAY